jgi:hypothetical protein
MIYSMELWQTKNPHRDEVMEISFTALRDVLNQVESRIATEKLPYAYRCSETTFKALCERLSPPVDSSHVESMKLCGVHIYPDPFMIEDGKFVPIFKEALHDEPVR